MQLSVKEVAELLNISEKTVYRWIDDRKLPGYRINGQYRFSRGELLEWAAINRLDVTPRLYEEPESRGSALPNLSIALESGGIFYRIGGRDQAAVLRHVVQTLRLPEAVDRGFLLQVLRAREALASTAIGDGIAVPHPRNPVVLHLAAPVVTLCFLEQPVDFSALDGQPVRALFTVLSPTVRAHLHLLSQLAFALRDAEFKGLVLGQVSREELTRVLRRITDALAP